jgi:branched-chain amino acid transport system ATP-binding protein
MLKINSISKSFGGVKALNKCNFEIQQGKITSLIGPNGSGKTTLFNVISNLIQKNSGSIFLEKENLSKKNAFEIAKEGISRTFQEVRLFDNLTIKDHLEIALMQDDEKLSNIFSKKENYSDKIKEILELIGLDKPSQTLAANLSYGQKKLLDLAIAIAKPHKVLMLDEPVAGVNPALRKQIKVILMKLQKSGETILLVEHDMNFVMDIADKVFVMDEAICFGWIDTTIKKLDEDKYIRTFSRRTKNSKWSNNTISYGKELIEQGRMTPAGLKFYKEGLLKPTHDAGIPKDPPMPEELRKALDKNFKAKENFNNFPPSTKKMHYRWILRGKREETRIKRINLIVNSAEEGKRNLFGTQDKVNN